MGKKKKRFRDVGSTCTNCRLLEYKLAEAFEHSMEKDSIIKELKSLVIELRADLQYATNAAYLGIEGAQRWLAEHIGYDLRQVAKCPSCTGIKTSPLHPEKIGARFVCKDCGQVFFIIKSISDDPEAVRYAYREARQAEQLEVEVLPTNDPYRGMGRGLGWVKALTGRNK